MHKNKEEVISRILVKESLNLELWLKSYEGLKFQGLLCKFPEKNQKIGFFWNCFGRKKSVDSVHGSMDRGATSDLPTDREPVAQTKCTEKVPFIAARAEGG
jgi:hypothetical protein